MILPDVNILVNAHRKDAERHRLCLDFLQSAINGEAAYGLSDLVISGFIRVVTHPRIFIEPSGLKEALHFARQIRDQSHRVSISPGPRHWSIFQSLCRQIDARGNLVPDAYLAALAMESGCELISLDKHFNRFAGLRWRFPE